MRDVVVVDTSIALKWVLVESDSPAARDLLAEWISNGMTIIAPTLLAYEVANVLYQHLRKNAISLERAGEALQAILLPVTLDDTNGLALSTRAMELAHQFHLPATYDAHYLALAEREDCHYWTADERLWNGVKTSLAWVRWLGNYHPGGKAGGS